MGAATHALGPHLGTDALELMSVFQGFNLLVFASLLLLATAHTWRPGDHSKARLGRRKGTALLATYVLCTASYPLAHQLLGIQN